ncbi:MAG: response regulator [Burkholderiales bacterium]|nr:response regulator [Burkholderiales bacterium]
MTAPDQPAPRHLLLVDDDRLVLSTLSMGLQQAGYRVSTAESAEEAEVLLAGGLRPDLAIVDIRMSGQDGLYLARRLRELDHIPFVMLSAYSEEHMIGQASQLGALGYLVKPLDTSQLLPAIEAALARANELQGLRETRTQLQAALDAERDISVAVGITMAQRHLARQDAFELLRKLARTQRRKLAELAAEIIRGE